MFFRSMDSKKNKEAMIKDVIYYLDRAIDASIIYKKRLKEIKELFLNNNLDFDMDKIIRVIKNRMYIEFIFSTNKKEVYSIRLMIEDSLLKRIEFYSLNPIFNEIEGTRIDLLKNNIECVTWTLYNNLNNKNLNEVIETKTPKVKKINHYVYGSLLSSEQRELNRITHIFAKKEEENKEQKEKLTCKDQELTHYFKCLSLTRKKDGAL